MDTAAYRYEIQADYGSGFETVALADTLERAEHLQALRADVPGCAATRLIDHEAPLNNPNP